MNYRVEILIKNNIDTLPVHLITDIVDKASIKINSNIVSKKEQHLKAGIKNCLKQNNSYNQTSKKPIQVLRKKGM